MHTASQASRSRHPQAPIAPAPRRRPGAVGNSATPAVAAAIDGASGADRSPAVGPSCLATEPAAENAVLFDYERSIKRAFDDIVPALKRIARLQDAADFERQAQSIARTELGCELPQDILAEAWIKGLDMRRLFAWCVFSAYRRLCNHFLAEDPLAAEAPADFDRFLQSCGFHTLDISPCADGRLAHLVRYVLRLPHRAVRRKSYAGALFDIEDSVSKWVETELSRFREGRPNTAEAPTRYLKLAAYHFSSVDPAHAGCAAHGSDRARAAAAALQRLLDFRLAIENSFCCGASIDLLLIGVDTDTDALRLHLPDAQGRIDPERFIDAAALFAQASSAAAPPAVGRVEAMIDLEAADAPAGMRRLAARLLAGNLAQIDYVRQFHGAGYADAGHAERFIGVGKGFEEIQLRNLMFFAYLDTVEEGAADLDVGVRIFSALNLRQGLPVPVVVRFDYHGEVPGARERAAQRCARVAESISVRYRQLADGGLLHVLQVVRDCSSEAPIEVLHCTAAADFGTEVH